MEYFERCTKLRRIRNKNTEGAIRTSFTAGYLNEMEAAAALDALEKRNLLSHNFNVATAIEAVDLIKHRYAPMLLALLRRRDEKLERE